MLKALTIINSLLIIAVLGFAYSNFTNIRQLKQQPKKITTKPSNKKSKNYSKSQNFLKKDFVFKADQKKEFIVKLEDFKKGSTDLRGLLRQVKIEREVNNDGKVVGFKIDKLTNDSFLNRYGMKKGDVILAVNDYSITSPNNAMLLYSRIIKSLHKGDRITVALGRDDKNVEFSYFFE